MERTRVFPNTHQQDSDGEKVHRNQNNSKTSLVVYVIGMIIIVIGMFLYNDRTSLRDELQHMMGNNDVIKIPTRAEINKMRVSRREKLRELLFKCNHQQYYESMVSVGIDRLSIIAEGREQDRIDAHIKIIHWNRIVKQARSSLLHSNIDITTRPPSTRIPQPSILPPVDDVTDVNPELSKNSPTTIEIKNQTIDQKHDTIPTVPIASNEKFLLLSTLTAGFASGVRTQLVPFLGLAAHLNRTAVLPSASFGIPAFRSTSKDVSQGFVPLSDFLDVESLKKDLPCVNIISYQEWLSRTTKEVDVVFLGSEKEMGNKSFPGIATKLIPKPPGATVGFQACFPQMLREVRMNSVYREKSYWGGPWDFIGETKHVLRTENTTVSNIMCAPLWQLRSNTKELFSAGGKSVMIANFPGLIRDAYFWHSQHAKGDMHIFQDVSRSVCGTWTSDFSKWPSLSQQWKSVAETTASQRFGKTPFACVHIRGEKLVLGAVKDGKVTIPELNENTYMRTCIESLVVIVKDAMSKSGDQLFLISDLDPVTGSPSAQRDRSFKKWITWAGKLISNSTSASASGFCNSPEQDEVLKTGPESLRKALSIFPGNCAAGEAAVCQLSSSVTRFGKGSMGAFVAGGKQATKYETCPEIISAAEKLR